MKSKLNAAYGLEWFIFFNLMIYLLSIVTGFIMFFQTENRANRLAKTINSVLVYNEELKHKYSQIGQFELTEEGTEEKIKEVLKYTSELNQQYGSDVLSYFIKESPYFTIGPDASIKLMINIEQIDYEGTIVNPGSGIILNDNELYYLSGDNLIQTTDFDLEGNYEKFCDIPNDYNSDLKNNDGSFKSKFSQIQENGEFRQVYYIPEITYNPEKMREIKKEEWFSVNTQAKELMDAIEMGYKKIGNTKRYVLDEEKTKEMINLLIEDYNERMDLKKHKFYTNFVDDESQFKEIYSDTTIADYNEALRSSDSFFFYGDASVNKENFGYRIRSYQKNDGVFFPLYNNSVRLVLKTRIDVPFLIENYEKKFGYDLILKKNN